MFIYGENDSFLFEYKVGGSNIGWSLCNIMIFFLMGKLN